MAISHRRDARQKVIHPFFRVSITFKQPSDCAYPSAYSCIKGGGKSLLDPALTYEPIGLFTMCVQQVVGVNLVSFLLHLRCAGVGTADGSICYTTLGNALLVPLCISTISRGRLSCSMTKMKWLNTDKRISRSSSSRFMNL